MDAVEQVLVYQSLPSNLPRTLISDYLRSALKTRQRQAWRSGPASVTGMRPTATSGHVRVYGNTAVVVGRWRARGENAGRSFDYQARFVSVWVRRDGEWRMVSDQSTPIA